MLPLHRLPNLLIPIPLLIKHVRAEVIQLGLVEARGQVRPGHHLDVLERRRQARRHLVRLDGLGHHAPQRGEARAEILGRARVGEEVDGGVVCVRRVEHGGEDLVREVVGLDDAAGAPDLPDGAVVDAPGVGVVGGGDGVEALDEGGEAGGVGGFSEVLDEGVFVWDGEFLRGKAT